MTEVPIACSLSLDGLSDRVDEWRDFFGSRVDAVERAANVVRVRLVDGDHALLAALLPATLQR